MDLIQARRFLRGHLAEIFDDINMLSQEQIDNILKLFLKRDKRKVINFWNIN